MMIYCAAFLYPTTIHGYTQGHNTVDYLPTLHSLSHLACMYTQTRSGSVKIIRLFKINTKLAVAKGEKLMKVKQWKAT